MGAEANPASLVDLGQSSRVRVEAMQPAADGDSQVSKGGLSAGPETRIF